MLLNSNRYPLEIHSDACKNPLEVKVNEASRRFLIEIIQDLVQVQEQEREHAQDQDLVHP